ncbi:MAG: rhodanese-like domain-containing protein [Bacteroidota bacterium]
MKILNSMWHQDIIALGAVLVFSAIVATTINVFRKDSLPWNYQTVRERFEAEVAEARANLDYAESLESKGLGVQDMDQSDLFKLVESKRVVVLDARPEVFHRLGHVPGALSFPRGEFSTKAEEHRTILRNAAEQDIPIVIYCASLTCKDADLVSEGLASVGMHDHWIFRPGWSAWKQSGLPIENNM